VEIRFRTRSGMVFGEGSKWRWVSSTSHHDVSFQADNLLYRPDHCLPTELLPNPASVGRVCEDIACFSSIGPVSTIVNIYPH